MLSLVSTPIGNLEDLSKRALQTLSECDAILCEDTRHSSRLLERYGIKKPLYSYHKFNEKRALERILEELSSGKHFALISDAGTPCISDPGMILVQACATRKIPFTAIPGPCSPIQALLLSALPTERFQFVGFLPKKGEKFLRQLLCYPGVTIAFESPQRLTATLGVLAKLDPMRQSAVAREMTKTFEECVRGTMEELLAHFQKTAPKGEICLCIGPGKMPLEGLTIEECVEMLQEFHGLSLKEAIKHSAHLLNTAKTVVYKQFHKK